MLRFLSDQRLAFVCVDEPQGFKSSLPPVAAATADVGIVRFHGRNATTWEQKDISAAERFAYDYTEHPGELEEWQARDPLVLAANHLRDEFGVSDERLREGGDDVERELGEVEQAALAAPFPEPTPSSEFA